MGDKIKYGKIQKPGEKSKGCATEAVIHRGSARTPCSSFDKRADHGNVNYVGPSKMEKR